jgi:hypothetical protein
VPLKAPPHTDYTKQVSASSPSEHSLVTDEDNDFEPGDNEVSLEVEGNHGKEESVRVDMRADDLEYDEAPRFVEYRHLSQRVLKQVQ